MDTIDPSIAKLTYRQLELGQNGRALPAACNAGRIRVRNRTRRGSVSAVVVRRVGRSRTQSLGVVFDPVHGVRLSLLLSILQQDE